MRELDPTCIGRVRQVQGATVTVELSPELAGISPIWRGRLVPVGQVGSLVRIPQGPVSLLASVVMVSIAELVNPPAPAHTPAQGNRWLQVQLLGEVDALGRFHRGVASYPGLDDPVHFTTTKDLVSIYPAPGSTHVGIGVLSAAPEVPVTLNAAPLVTRHAAIVGSTGSGKTSAVASVLQSFCTGGWSSANVVIVDPHGEYASALQGHASVRSVRGTGEQGLAVPYWALPADELLALLCAVDSKTIRDKFSDLVISERRSFASSADWLDLDNEAISADTPIPFDLRNVWYQLDFANRVTLGKQNDLSTAQVDDPGDATTLTPPTFAPYALGSAAPFKGPTFRHYSPAAERLRLRLLDPLYSFLLEIPVHGNHDPLVPLVASWLGDAEPVSVLDFSGVSTDVADVAIGVVLDLLFEIAVRGTTTDGIGRHRPVLVVLEEAHRYLGEGTTARLAKRAANRIAREGRKYGIGLVMVTQRPSELPDTALAQCGTIIALRLTNGADQTTVRNALPDSVSGLASALPALRTGEALITGESIVLPTRVLIRRPSPEPEAGDPTLDGWRKDPQANSLEQSIERWRNDTSGGGSV